MSEVVDRWVIEIGGDGKPRPLSEYRDRPAYVLLGDPGAGKTTAFAQEAQSQGGHRVTAGDFLALSLHKHTEWKREPLLIDGLDEVRAGGSDPRTPLNGIRARLEELGEPQFRISCREADWWGDHDQLKLARLSRDGKIVVLRLAALTLDEQVRVLHGREGIADARTWLLKAAERGSARPSWQRTVSRPLGPGFRGEERMAHQPPPSIRRGRQAIGSRKEV